ncbi:hypothetical protein [Streptomyces sp. NRRL S-495]|uniref:hypothetical protein n=1 Tax=Streptomyces sp. NRRL S-495 TaxID=1609133 RepID=UPI000ACF69C2|nr:hypothetical protein [Streptomyces sp. NRRL S-495]
MHRPAVRPLRRGRGPRRAASPPRPRGRRRPAPAPGRCPQLVAALAEDPPPTYRELSHRLGMPRGSIGPTRARCLACLRVLLHAERYA